MKLRTKIFIFAGAALVCSILLALYSMLSGSKAVAVAYVEAVRGNKLADARVLVVDDAHLDSVAVASIHDGKGEVSGTETAGFGHAGAFTPYACHKIGSNVWMILLKRSGDWKVYELFTTIPSACQGDD